MTDIPVAFVATAQPMALPHNGETTGTTYAIYPSQLRNVPLGWVCRATDGQWWAWNQHRDFWVGFGRTREEAAQGMLRARWSAFQRFAPNPHAGDEERERIFAAGMAAAREEACAPKRARAR